LSAPATTVRFTGIAHFQSQRIFINEWRPVNRGSTRLSMYNFEETEPQAPIASGEPHPLLLDGTVYLDYVDDDAPRANGLLAYLKQYLGVRNA
jgi:hypothetical protein